MPFLNQIDIAEPTSSKLDNSVQTPNASAQSVPFPLKKLFPTKVIDKNRPTFATRNTLATSAPRFANVDANTFFPQRG